MKEYKDIIDSGILENYCLGLASDVEIQEVVSLMAKFPELRVEVASMEEGLQNYALQFSVDPPSGLRSSILEKIDSISVPAANSGEALFKEGIHERSDHKSWIDLVADMNPPHEFDIHLTPIHKDENRILSVCWVNELIPEESHTDIHESFLLLEGTCTCRLGDNYFDLKPGDFFLIPLHIVHSLKVTSKGPVKFILQRKLSA